MSKTITPAQRINATREQFNQFTPPLDKTQPDGHNEATIKQSAVSAPDSHAVFLCLLLGSHVFSDGSRAGNTTPSGNTSRRLIAVVEARRPTQATSLN